MEIDFITPDSSRPWTEVGGAICEVISQPRLGPYGSNVSSLFFDGLLGGHGRIPVAFFVNYDGNDAWINEIECIFSDCQTVIGVVSARTLSVGNRVWDRNWVSTYHAVNQLLADPTVDLILVFTDGLDLIDTGLPVDKFDLLVMDGQVDHSVKALLLASNPKTAVELNNETSNPLPFAVSEALKEMSVNLLPAGSQACVK